MELVGLLVNWGLIKKDQMQITYARKIYEMLDIIHKRPTLFLNSKSISALENFLSGYCIWALDNNEIYNPGEREFNDFKYMVMNSTDISSGIEFPFSRALLKECKGDEALAFERFFEYLEIYKSEKV